MKKKVKAFIKLQIKAGEANPAPPIGSSLGQHGVNIMDFCTKFNQSSQHLEKGIPTPVIITVYVDRSFTFILKLPPASILLKRIAGITAGSSTPHTNKVGKITFQQLKEVAAMKLPDLTAADIDAAMRTIAGTARSMGIEVETTGG